MAELLERLTAALADRYRIERKLGAGGMATVYLAYDRKHDRKVALKVLRPELAAVLGAERFVQEIKTTANLQHPHILPLFESGEADSFLYYVMPFIEGETLRDKLNREKQLSIEEAVKITTEVADALDYAHRHGVIHRDIKPENILLHEGRPIVADFGVALALSTGHQHRLTEPGLALGTPEYMSPEQAVGDRELDVRSDVYSLACITYELLTGEPPYAGRSARAVITKHIVDPVPSARRLRPGVLPRLDAALERALAKVPADRYATIADFSEAVAVGDRSAAHGGHRSVAVLPFVTIGSADSGDAYLGEGLSEDIIGQLAKVPGLKVISRASVMQFRDRTMGIPEVARRLGVTAVLDGSIRRVDNRVRVAAQLIDATTDEHLWAERYDRELSDAFALQAEVAERIAMALEAELTPEVRARLDAPATYDPEAYRLVLLGRFHANKWSLEGWQRGMEYLTQAIERDPRYAAPHATLALHNVIRAYTGALPPQEAYRAAESEARTALLLDPDDADAHLAQALVSYFYHWDWSAAGRSFERAIASRPGHSTAHTFHGSLLDTLCRPRDALRARRRGYELAPLDPTAAFNLAYGYLCARRYVEAIAQFERALELDAASLAAIYGLGITQVESGQVDAACRTFERGCRMDRSSIMQGFLGWAYARAGRVDAARAVLERVLGAEDLAYVSPIHVALVYLGLGRHDEFFAWLERAIAERSTWLVWIHITPSFDPVYDDPRFHDALRQIGLEAFAPRRDPMPPDTGTGHQVTASV